MEGIKQWAFSLCAAMVACGMCRMALPSLRMERVMRTTISVFFLCCLLSPVILEWPELRVQVEEISPRDIENRVARLESVVDSQTEDAARRNLERLIAEKLSAMGIKDYAVTINITTNGQNEPQIEDVQITLDLQHKPEHASIRSALEETLGLEVRLRYDNR